MESKENDNISVDQFRAELLVRRDIWQTTRSLERTISMGAFCGSWEEWRKEERRAYNAIIECAAGHLQPVQGTFAGAKFLALAISAGRNVDHDMYVGSDLLDEYMEGEEPVAEPSISLEQYVTELQKLREDWLKIRLGNGTAPGPGKGGDWRVWMKKESQAKRNLLIFAVRHLRAIARTSVGKDFLQETVQAACPDKESIKPFKYTLLESLMYDEELDGRPTKKADESNTADTSEIDKIATEMYNRAFWALLEEKR